MGLDDRNRAMSWLKPTEEVLSDIRCVVGHTTDGPQCDVELSDEDQGDEDDTEPRAINTAHSLERQFVNGVSLDGPSTTEANVAKADRQPGEESGETRESQQPHDYMLLLE